MKTIDEAAIDFIDKVVQMPSNFSNYPKVIFCNNLFCDKCPLSGVDCTPMGGISPPIEVKNYVETKYPEVLL
jgi:hypothetical protein